MLALELKDVNYSYFTKEKETKALQDINLSVKKGQFISIVGPSGCGKSTLLSIICGLIEPTSGEVIVNGRPVKDEMRNIGYMLQHDHLFEWRSVYGNVMLGLDIHRKKTHEILPPTISPNMVSSILKIQDQASFQAVCGKELLLYAHL